jgi:hypothetical protein
MNSATNQRFLMMSVVLYAYIYNPYAQYHVQENMRGYIVSEASNHHVKIAHLQDSII